MPDSTQYTMFNALFRCSGHTPYSLWGGDAFKGVAGSATRHLNERGVRARVRARRVGIGSGLEIGLPK